MLCYSALNLQGGQSKVPHGPPVLFLESELSPKRPSEKSFAAFPGGRLGERTIPRKQLPNRTPCPWYLETLALCLLGKEAAGLRNGVR